MERVRLKRRRRKRVPLVINVRPVNGRCTGEFYRLLKGTLHPPGPPGARRLVSAAYQEFLFDYLRDCQKRNPLDGVEPLPHDDDDGDGDQLVPV